MAQILLVGTATLDLVFTLKRYPQQDDEVRAQSLRTCRGGNAANTAVVLSQLGHRCSFVGVLADAPETAVIERDFARYGVDFSSCPRLPGKPPTSSIQLTGDSRTIVHYRDLPELTAGQFARIDLTAYDWVHFEGRNIPELAKMLEHTHRQHPEAQVSLELEKPREGMEALLDQVTLLLCSRGYARSRGYGEAREFLAWLGALAPQVQGTVAWGEAGALGRNGLGEVFHSPSCPPARVIDTLGAGDTFNAGMISALVKGVALSGALDNACHLAGRKCSVSGFELEAWRNDDA